MPHTFYSPPDIELLLTAVGAIERSQIPGATTTFSKSDDGRGEDSDGEEEGFGGNRRKTKPTIRKNDKDDEDEDDFDL